MRVLILGVNGFIGNALTHRILKTTDWEVYGLDMSSEKIESFLGDKRFRFLEGDIAINKEWIEYHIKKSDVVLPLVAIATPSKYVSDPLGVFELDFEENLRIIKQCARYGKRVVFPSTSEVYGMCPDQEFDEETSNLVQRKGARACSRSSCTTSSTASRSSSWTAAASAARSRTSTTASTR